MIGFSYTSDKLLLRIATNEIVSRYIDNGLRQMAFIVFAKVGKGRLTRDTMVVIHRDTMSPWCPSIVLSVFFFKFYIWFSRRLSQKVKNNSIDSELAGGRKLSGEQYVSELSV